METNGHKTIKVGMKVVYRGSWGHDAPKETTIEYIELCENGEKYGEPMSEVSVKDIKNCTFDLADGHWAYGYQITKIIG